MTSFGLFSLRSCELSCLSCGSGGSLVLPDGILEQGVLGVENERIEAVLRPDEFDGAVDFDFGDSYVGPGFIDLHFHGCVGHEFTGGESAGFDKILAHCVKSGTTGVLAGIATAPFEKMKAATNMVQKYMGEKNGCGRQAELIGVHLEGPFVNPTARGAMKPEWMLPPSVASYREFEESGVIRMITLAPELEGADDLIRYIAENSSVIVSAGHTRASCEQISRAAGFGVTHLTHLFNAMTGLHHRQPGAAGAGLFDDRLTVEIITDKIHVHPKMYELALKMKGAGQGLPYNRFRRGRRAARRRLSIRRQDGILQKREDFA